MKLTIKGMPFDIEGSPSEMSALVNFLREPNEETKAQSGNVSGPQEPDRLGYFIAQDTRIRDLIRQGRHIDAIRLHRATYSTYLKESKRACDSIRDGMGMHPRFL